MINQIGRTKRNFVTFGFFLYYHYYNDLGSNKLDTVE